MRKRNAMLHSLLLVVLGAGCTACEQTPPEVPEPPPRIGLVNDYAAVFDRASKERIESLLMELKRKAEIEFLILTVRTTTWMSIADYTYNTVQLWELDAPNRSPADVLLLVVALDDGTYHFSTSPSMRRDLPPDGGREIAEKSLDKNELVEGIEEFVNLIVESLEQNRAFSLSRDN